MRTSLLALGCAVVLAACGSTGTTGDSNTGGSSSSGGGSSSGGSGSGSGGGGSSSGAGNDGGTVGDTGAPPGSYTITFGPVQVPPSTEKTQCIIERLGNLAPLHVGQIHDLLGTSSHHMIVYKVSDTTEQKTPFDCQPFQGALNPANGNPLIISQKKDDLLTLPPNVAFTLDANQMIRLEMHYINANPTQTVTLISSTTMIPIPDADYKWDASFLFIGDMDISIPPMSSATLGPQFFPMPSQFNTSNFFAITGHEHQWGTKVQVWDSKQSGDLSSLRYTNTTWSDPVTTQYSPPLRIGSGGGFTYQCDWYNASSSTVSFGESANDEMCFFWAYYWPSQGAQVCFQSKSLAPVGGTACCPMAGAAICNNL